MTADADLARLARRRRPRRRQARARRRPPPARPPSGPAAPSTPSLDRHPDPSSRLDENVRQHDPDERAALDQLRSGSVPDGCRLVRANGRIHIAPNRVETLAAMVDAWADDVDAGHDTHAVRVAARRRRRPQPPGPRPLRPARPSPRPRPDRHPADAATPPATGSSPSPPTRRRTRHQRTAHRHRRRPDRHVTLRTDDGRHVALTGDGIDADHLDHGYATTVHRAQGATYDRAHVLADGGGRELAYVAISRARDRTTMHAAADDLAQAVDDLEPTGATSTANAGSPTRQRPLTLGKAKLVHDLDAHHERLRHERAELEALAPPDRTQDLNNASQSGVGRSGRR